VPRGRRGVVSTLVWLPVFSASFVHSGLGWFENRIRTDNMYLINGRKLERLDEIHN